MGYRIEVLEAAEVDAEIIYDWYEEQSEGLGEKFIEALEDAKQKIIKNPFAYRIWHKEIRRFILKPFSYKAYYRVKNNLVTIFLIAHNKRSNKFLKKDNQS